MLNLLKDILKNILDNKADETTISKLKFILFQIENVKDDPFTQIQKTQICSHASHKDQNSFHSSIIPQENLSQMNSSNQRPNGQFFQPNALKNSKNTDEFLPENLAKRNSNNNSNCNPQTATRQTPINKTPNIPSQFSTQNKDTKMLDVQVRNNPPKIDHKMTLNKTPSNPNMNSQPIIKKNVDVDMNKDNDKKEDEQSTFSRVEETLQQITSQGKFKTVLPYLSLSKQKTEEVSKINIEFVLDGNHKIIQSTRNLKDMDNKLWHSVYSSQLDNLLQNKIINIPERDKLIVIINTLLN